MSTPMLKQRAFGLLLLAAALLAAPLLAQAAAPRKLVHIEGVTEYRLDNGLRVLVLPEPAADTVTVHITYLVGSRHEGYGEKGMAHLLEHLLFKGSKRHPRIKEEFTQRGARWNGSTSPDRTNYFETLPASDASLDWALGMEADRMRNSFISKSDLDSEMTVVRNEFEMGENNPGSILYQRMQRLVYDWHNYGNSVIGARSDIENVPIERLRAFYRNWYRPDNAVLIVSGRIDEARALQRVEKHFGGLPRPKQAMPALYTAEPTKDGERSVTLRRSGDNPLVGAMYRIPAASHPDYPAIEVLAGLLGTAPTGRLHKALVQKGLATHVWGSERSMYDPGVAFFGASLPKEAPLNAARAALLGVLDGITAEPIREDEVARAKIASLNDFEKTRIDAPS
ncbi:MAG: insulinase family protein, partial [Betaproteobacteria bacterium]|nr:insulinase family protein [Betaproteobacteria bacterium]